MVDFASLKRDRASQLEKINSVLKSQTPQQDEKSSDLYWKPTVDEAGNGSAIIRFLPAPPGEDVPFVRYWNHAFQGPTGKWYIENSLTTIGQPDPVSEYNKELWDTGTEDNKKIVRNQKRKLHYVSNILVVKDPGNPEKEGKVFLFEYGKKIFDKIQDAMVPDELDDEATPLNPFDLWEGANFRLKIRKVEGYRNYDKSEFDKKAPAAKTDEELEKIWKSQHPLTTVIAPEKFLSYDVLKAKLYRVLNLGSPQTGNGQPASTVRSSAPVDNTPPWDDEPTVTPAPSAGKTRGAPAPAPTDDEELDFFRRLGSDE